jgi:hypothetical protein
VLDLLKILGTGLDLEEDGREDLLEKIQDPTNKTITDAKTAFRWDLLENILDAKNKTIEDPKSAFRAFVNQDSMTALTQQLEGRHGKFITSALKMHFHMDPSRRRATEMEVLSKLGQIQDISEKLELPLAKICYENKVNELGGILLENYRLFQGELNDCKISTATGLEAKLQSVARSAEALSAMGDVWKAHLRGKESTQGLEEFGINFEEECARRMLEFAEDLHTKLELAAKELGVSSIALNWEDTFYFATREMILQSAADTMPKHQDCRESWLLKKKITMQEACQLLFKEEYVAVSHRWEEKGKPDPSGQQFEKVREYLVAHPKIKYIWFDYTCMAQGSRTFEESYEFKHMLQNVNRLYLGMSVLIVMDLSYMR